RGPHLRRGEEDRLEGRIPGALVHRPLRAVRVSYYTHLLVPLDPRLAPAPAAVATFFEAAQKFLVAPVTVTLYDHAPSAGGAKRLVADGVEVSRPSTHPLGAIGEIAKAAEGLTSWHVTLAGM